ncbi:hypothetical protein LAZ67_14003317, partial [Cordylochernes scorpioides]
MDNSAELEPVFLEPIPNVTMPIGRDAKLTCVVDRLGTYRLIMSLRKILADDLKWRAVGRMEAGQSQVEVAKWLNVNKSVVRKIWKQFIETGTIKRKEGSGIKRKTASSEDRYLVVTAKRHREMTAIQLSNELSSATGTRISRQTVYQRLHEGALYARRLMVCILLTSAHRRARLNCCLEHHAWTHDQLANVLFSDESRFSLNTDSRRVFIWREPGTRYHPSNIREIDSFRGGSLLVWAGISSSRRTPLHIFSGGTLTAQRYRDEILEPYLRPYRDQIGHNLILIDDNARPHRARLVNEYLQSENIRRMNWPARSPDLNPIEHVWDALGRRIGARHPSPRTLVELRTALLEEWGLLPLDFLQSLMVETRSGKMQDPAQERIKAEESAKPQPGATIGGDASSDPVVLNPNIDIPKYDGTEDPRPWIESLEEIGFLYHWADYIISRYAAMNMIGSAKTWLNLHKISFTSWENFKSRLIEDFASDANKEEMKMRLNRMQQWNEPAIRFAEDILVLCNKVDPQMEEETKINWVIGGLKKEYSFALHLNPPKNTNELLEICKKLDLFEKNYQERAEKSRALYIGPRSPRPHHQEQWKNATSFRRPYQNTSKPQASAPRYYQNTSKFQAPTPRYYQNKPLPQVSAPRRSYTPNPGPKPVYPSKTYNKNPNSNRNRTEDGRPICFKCNKPGHVARYCRVKASIEAEDGEYVIEENNKMTQTNGLRLARSLLTVTDKKTHIWITNPYPRPLKIMKDQTLAYGSLPAEVNFIENIEKQNENDEIQFQINKNLSFKEQERLKQILAKYTDLFSSRLGRTNLEKHQIHTEDAKPIKHKPYRVSAKERTIIKDQIDEMLEEGIIRPSSSPWSFPVILVKKRDGKYRFCVDYRKLNEVTVKDVYPIPRIDDVMDSLQGSKYFSAIDLKSGYWQVEIEERDKEKTAFTTAHGLYEFNVMPFGLCNAPATFERNMENMLGNLRWQICLCYLDDVIIYSPDFPTHLKRLEAVFRYFRESNLRLYDKKCRFGFEELEILGYITRKHGKKHLDADGLSRGPLPETDWDEDFERLFLNQITDEEDKFIESVTKNLNGSRRSIAQNFKEEDGCLFKKNPNPESRAWLLVVPEKKKREIMKEYHNHMSNGHLGVARTMYRIKSKYFWPSMLKDVSEFFKTCHLCQSRKGSNQLPSGLLQPIPPANFPFERIGIDFVGPLPSTKNRKKWIIVLTDYYIRYAETRAVSEATVKEVSKFLVEDIFLRHGAPQYLISDRGSQFTSNLMKERMPGHRKRRQFKQTDAFTRGMVIGLKRAGWSIRQIADDTHLGASTVHRLWRRWLEQGNVAIYRNVGATRVTSARVDRRILRQAVAAPQATCTAILQHVQDTLDHSISTRTISRRLVANGLHSCRPLRRLPLTPPNRRQRLEWCRARSTWMKEWDRVVFSDESRFCSSIDSRRVRVWRRRGERSNPAAIVERPTVRQRGIMVLGAIAYDSRSPLLRIQGTMTAQRYVDDVLRPVTLPYLQGVPKALYQQDNSRPHTARIRQQALQDVQMLPWPPYSPDLSPIEHVWDIIGRRLHALPQPRSEDELWQMVEREWRAIPQDAIRTLIDSLPRRVAACIAVR